MHPKRWLRHRFLRFVVKVYRQRPFSRADALAAANRRLRARLVLAEDSDRMLRLALTREQIRADGLAVCYTNALKRAADAEWELRRRGQRELSGVN